MSIVRREIIYTMDKDTVPTKDTVTKTVNVYYWDVGQGGRDRHG